MKNLLLAVALALAAAATPAGARADERIPDFHSDVTVMQSGDLRVRETIQVRAEGREIRHGIYRDFPTDYKDNAGNRYRVGFHVTGVLRDGVREDYHLQSLSNGMRVYIGGKNRMVAPGVHIYTLTYETNRQLGFFADHDELYWNVTGNGWAFPIDHASAAVTLPAGVAHDQIRVEGYTGPQGAKGRQYTAQVAADGSARFETTRALGPHEGLTIVVSWPKGYVHEPTAAERAAYLLSDNRNLLGGLIGLAVLLGYYYVVWRRVGVDPAAGVVIPLYYPPKDHSPASMRFVRRMGYDNKVFAAAVVNLAVKGLIHIAENGSYTLSKTDKEGVELAPGENAVMNKLFAQGDSVVLKNTNHTLVSSAITAHKNSLKLDYEKKFFVTNSNWLVPGILITLVVLGVVGLLSSSAGSGQGGGFLMLWLSFWTVGVVFLGQMVVTGWRGAAGGAGYVGAIFITLFALPFFLAEIVVAFLLAKTVSITVVVVLAAAIAINIVFYQWLKRPTLAGRRLLDQIDGFRLYLNVAEKDELKVQDPIKKTPELFETYLPYALALDVEQRWSERFAQVFRDLAERGQTYQPLWYQGSHWNAYQVGGFTSAVGGSLSSAISSASTAPGSSSGSGGGGSSGGGGGGGGGGGW